jgi:hypothetical protein
MLSLSPSPSKKENTHRQRYRDHLRHDSIVYLSLTLPSLLPCPRATPTHISDGCGRRLLFPATMDSPHRLICTTPNPLPHHVLSACSLADPVETRSSPPPPLSHVQLLSPGSLIQWRQGPPLPLLCRACNCSRRPLLRHPCNPPRRRILRL